MFEDAELEALLDQDSCQTQEGLARAIGVTQQAISHHLKSSGMIQKQGNRVPYELTSRNIEHRFSTCEMLLARLSQIFMEKNSCCVFGRISLVSCIMSCSNLMKQLLGLSKQHNWAD